MRLTRVTQEFDCMFYCSCANPQKSLKIFQGGVLPPLSFNLVVCGHLTHDLLLRLFR